MNYAGSHGIASSSKNATVRSPQDEDALQALAELDIAEKAAIVKASNSKDKLGSTTALATKFVENPMPTMATKQQPTAATQFLSMSNNMMGAGLSTS